MFPPAKPLKGLLWLVIKSGREHLADPRLSTQQGSFLSGPLFASSLRLKAVSLPTRPGRAGGFQFKTKGLVWECVYWGGGKAFPLTAIDINSYTMSPAREAGYLQGETGRRRQGLQRASAGGKSSWISVSGSQGAAEAVGSGAAHVNGACPNSIQIPPSLRSAQSNVVPPRELQ